MADRNIIEVSGGLVVAPAGFEPAISTLRGWHPWPLDDGASSLGCLDSNQD